MGAEAYNKEMHELIDENAGGCRTAFDYTFVFFCKRLNRKELKQLQVNSVDCFIKH